MIDLSDHFVAQYRALEQAHERLSKEHARCVSATQGEGGTREQLRELQRKYEQERAARTAAEQQCGQLKQSAEAAEAKAKELETVREELRRWQEKPVPRPPADEILIADLKDEVNTLKRENLRLERKIFDLEKALDKCQ